MTYQLQARLTREGWYYLAVLSFIVGGAALCHVNLLVVLGGMMLAPILINWRLSLASLRGVSIRALPIRAVHAGQPLVAEFEIHNSRRWFAAWLLTVEDRWSLEHRTLQPLRGGILEPVLLWRYLFEKSKQSIAMVFCPCVAPGETVRVHYEMVFSRRGRYEVPVLRLRTCFPLGLVEGVAIVAAPRQAAILPRIGRLSAEWTHRIAAAISGEGEPQFKQRSTDGDFFAVRPWQSGDSTRWLHWRTTARAGKPMVRQFERESSPTVAIVLDPYLPAVPTSGEHARFEAAISFVATALADLAQRNVSQLAILIASAERHCWLGSRSPVFLEEVLQQLTKLSGESGDHRAATAELLEAELPATACVLVISSRPGLEAAAVTTAPQSAPSFSDDHTIRVASAEFSALYSLE
ncbi:DUF58 domain-containing protein [Anatilimnocola sp. NA78]|uniref:DUF58 domain-containing protein n=1 Tax=Anatilimnocola sp. NA78 TaxID=3415683 RepID=UPI003CE55449